MKKARVLLVSPNLKGITDGITRIQPTMGLLLIAPILQRAGHTVKIYDSALDGWNTRKTLDANQHLNLKFQYDILDNNGISRDKFGDEFFKLIGDILYHIIITQSEHNSEYPNDRTNNPQ